MEPVIIVPDRRFNKGKIKATVAGDNGKVTKRELRGHPDSVKIWWRGETEGRPILMVTNELGNAMRESGILDR